MSEYRYYEFQAIERPLDDAARKALRAMSTRARITASSFTNTYEWGNFWGSPQDLMARWERRKDEEAGASNQRLAAAKRQGEGAWEQIERDIERRNASGYTSAMKTLQDLGILARMKGDAAAFAGRIARLRQAHSRKTGFIARLKDIAT